MLMAMALGSAMLQGELRLASPFTDHMVLQRERPVRIFGQAAPGAEVVVEFQGQRASAKTDSKGDWLVTLKPLSLGPAAKLQVRSGGESVTLDDVLVGDVWLCSGQSNMEMGLNMVRDGAKEVANADHPQIRLLKVPKVTLPSPTREAELQWTVCTPKSVAEAGWGGFSAVAYFFGRKLHQDLKVPIGLIDSSWGGTVAEAWVTREGLEPLEDFNAALKRVAGYAADPAGTEKRFWESYDAWYTAHDPGTKGGFQAPDLDESDWEKVQVPEWFQELNGIYWYRKTIELTEEQARSAKPVLSLGNCDDQDTTWVNGQVVGRMDGWWSWRVYNLEPGILKPGKNVIAVRMIDRMWGGGLSSPAETMKLYLDGGAVDLPGEWRRKITAKYGPIPNPEPSIIGDPLQPSVLNNGMIRPLVPFTLRGAIWYQGESNGGRGAQYGRLLPALIGDWRRNFQSGDFPFYIVSLAPYGPAAKDPEEGGWADLRESQRTTALKVKNAGLISTLDIGDAGDIHPANKQDVGLRLALMALGQEYKRPVASSGPTYKSMRIEGGEVRLRFDHLFGGLEQRGPRLSGFTIAGEDRKFVWAEAALAGDEVVVWSPKVPSPKAVRYAWAQNPPSSLFNRAGLPATPFRTDDWPLPSEGVK